MTRQSRIEDGLRRALAPVVLEVVDESSMHSVPAGAETHFKVVVVSPIFEGRSHVARHRLVYDALAAEMKSGVHALAITSRTPAEWESSGQSSAASPPCLGGSKAEGGPPAGAPGR